MTGWPKREHYEPVQFSDSPHADIDGLLTRAYKDGRNSMHDACTQALRSQEWPEESVCVCNSPNTSDSSGTIWGCECGAYAANAMRSRFLEKIKGMVGG